MAPLALKNYDKNCTPHKKFIRQQDFFKKILLVTTKNWKHSQTCTHRHALTCACMRIHLHAQTCTHMHAHTQSLLVTALADLSLSTWLSSVQSVPYKYLSHSLHHSVITMSKTQENNDSFNVARFLFFSFKLQYSLLEWHVTRQNSCYWNRTVYFVPVFFCFVHPLKMALLAIFSQILYLYSYSLSLSLSLSLTHTHTHTNMHAHTC